MRLPGLALLVALAAAGSAATPDCGLVPGWPQHGAARAYTADTLFEYMDGNSEAYLLYGFLKMDGVSCQKDGVTLLIDVSEFADAESAYGMYASNRDLRRPESQIGTGGQVGPRRAIFAKGKYYVEAAINQEGDYSTVLTQWAAALAAHTEGSTALPPELAWFPPGQQSLRLVPESVLGIRLLTRGYVGESDAGKAFVVTADSPAAAIALMEKLRARFPESIAATLADDAFQATDSYLGRLAIFRKGPRIAGYGKIAEGQDPLTLARTLAARLP